MGQFLAVHVSDDGTKRFIVFDREYRAVESVRDNTCGIFEIGQDFKRMRYDGFVAPWEIMPDADQSQAVLFCVCLNGLYFVGVCDAPGISIYYHVVFHVHSRWHVFRIVENQYRVYVLFGTNTC